jgi:hypothetical protein
MGRRPIAGLPEPVDDLNGWIEGLAVTIHTRNAELLGMAFWDFHCADFESGEGLAEVTALRRESRVKGIDHLVEVAWRRAGAVGPPPETLRTTFALNFSAFATQALMIDFEQTPEQIGRLTADTVKMVLWREVDAQRRATRDGATDSDENAHA